ncbi:MAG: hypothetical protein ACK56I_26285, partial [bacterium]
STARGAVATACASEPPVKAHRVSPASHAKRQPRAPGRSGRDGGGPWRVTGARPPAAQADRAGRST